MEQTYSLLICFAAVSAVFVFSRLYGRMAGMFAAAMFGVSVAWIMPPSFSFHIQSFVDRLALAGYGAVSVVVVAKFAAEKLRAYDAIEVPSHASERVRTYLSQIVPPVNTVEVAIAEMVLAADCTAARQTLEQVFAQALSQPGVDRISVYGGRGPGVDRIWVAARYRSLPEEPCVVISGRRVDGDPMISCFDNGYERVYQISLPTASKQESQSDPA